MEDLDGKWILAKDTACPEKDTSPATLGLTNMAGMYDNLCELYKTICMNCRETSSGGS